MRYDNHYISEGLTRINEQAYHHPVPEIHFFANGSEPSTEGKTAKDGHPHLKNSSSKGFV